MSFLTSFIYLNNDLDKISFFELWQKNKIINSADLLLVNAITTEDDWANELLTLASHNNYYLISKNTCNSRPELWWCKTDKTPHKISGHYLSCDTIARFLYQTITEFSPKVLFIHFSNIYHYENIVQKLRNNAILYNSSVDLCTSGRAADGQYNPGFIKSFFDFVQSFQLIDSLCKKHNVRFYWTSNCPYLQNMSKENLKFYLNTNCFFVRTKKHYHQKVARKFYKILKRL